MIAFGDRKIYFFTADSPLPDLQIEKGEKGRDIGIKGFPVITGEGGGQECKL